MEKIGPDIFEIISRRIAVRTYEPRPADVTALEAVRETGERAESLTTVDMRVYLRSHEEMGGEVMGVIGNYGKTIRAPHYLVLASREGAGYLVDAGFRFEQVVLEATRRGLGTCWVGLMFKEASLRANLGLDPSWRIIVLTPIGLPAAPTVTSRLLRTMVRSSTRKPVEQMFFWQHDGTPLPREILSDARIPRLLDATRWAPSWRNIQPWNFILTGREILVYKKRSRDREGKDYHLLDCGIAMSHLHLAARALGFEGRWRLERFEVPGDADAEPVAKFPLLLV